MTILGLLLKLGPYLLGLLGIAWGIFKHMQANVKIAGAAAAVAQAGAQVSNEQAAEAEANTTATQESLDAARFRASLDDTPQTHEQLEAEKAKWTRD